MGSIADYCLTHGHEWNKDGSYCYSCGARPVKVRTLKSHADLKQEANKELDPAGLDPKTQGAKLDLGKSPIFQGLLKYFPLALSAVSMVSLAGSKKYHWGGWSKVDDGFNRYSNALGRHLLKESYELYDDVDDKGNEGTHYLHAAQVAWNALARLEFLLKEHEVYNDSQKVHMAGTSNPSA